jgi:glycosyltransferase involved in cell wall biosynthesis
MPKRGLLNKYSIGWFSARYEFTALKKVKMFSLPTNDRLIYYPNLNSKTKYFELPNYPSQRVYGKTNINANLQNNDTIKIIYQGTIGWGHSIEEIIKLLKEKINDKSLTLTLKGKVKNDYKETIEQLADSYGVKDKINWVGIGAYKDVQKITYEHHLGIAIHLGDIPQGTASNKIYEYAACGLPALVYDNEQFRKHLNKYSWAVFTDGSVNSLKNAITYCDSNYQELSKCAKSDFVSFFLFETNFEMIKNYLLENISKKTKN